jgi:two-component system cell cycle sensor histidine kinase PleC
MTPEPPQARLWVRRAMLSYLLFAFSWASMAVFLWAPRHDLNNMIVIMLLACTLAGNSALVGSSRQLAASCFVIYGAACVTAALRHGGLIYNGIAALAVFFMVYLAHMARQIYATARDMLMLRNDKSDLIAALARAKRESDEARDRAEAASRAKSEFLANMSHELRTPLNAILGFSELITSRAFRDDVEKHHEYAGLIHGSGRHLLALINDILDLARIEAGKLELREAILDLPQLIEDATTMIAPRASASGCHLRADCPPELPALCADERAIKQVLLNLLANAVKFTPSGGAVTAFARLERDGSISFGVVDTGVGIREDDRERVMQTFGQGRHDVAAHDKGAGLGLPIAKGLVEAHGGRIDLESGLGQGTRVTARMPPARTVPQPARLRAS